MKVRLKGRWPAVLLDEGEEFWWGRLDVKDENGRETVLHAIPKLDEFDFNSQSTGTKFFIGRINGTMRLIICPKGWRVCPLVRYDASSQERNQALEAIRRENIQNATIHELSSK